jgi:dethiobiotin synthetase
MTALLVTATGTGVGKTVVTAAIAALAVARGDRVVAVKPAQTGESDSGGGDLAEISRLAGPVRCVELARYPDPLSPEAAARRSGRPTLTLEQCVEAIDAAQQEAELVLVEGAGGLLVRYDEAGLTIADVASQLGLPVVLVTEPGLGTLNLTALTLEAMRSRGLRLHALVIGSWPRQAGLAECSNIADLQAVTGRQLDGLLPEGAGALSGPDFLEAARCGLGPVFGGDLVVAALDALARR